MVKIKGVHISRVLVVGIVVLISLSLLPWVISDQYVIRIIIRIVLNMTMTVSLWVILSTGQVSFAHAAFMSIGAFACTLLVVHAHLNFWLAWPLGAIMAGTVALAIGVPVLRLRGAYFFMVTFAFSEVIRVLFKSMWKSVLGGPMGIVGIPPPNSIGPWHFGRIDIVGFYYLVLFLGGMCWFVMHGLFRCRIGLTFRSIESCDFFAESLGIDIMKYKLLAFGIGCFFAGLGGGFYAHYYSHITADCFGIMLGIGLLANCVVGGMASPVGPVIGATFLGLLDEGLRTLGPYEVITSSAIMILVIMFFPQGLLGLLKQFSTLITRSFASGKKS